MSALLHLDLKGIKGHLKELDGIRGLAIGLVLAFHLFPYFPFSKIGWVGVDLFFVLSGFLITGILIDTSETKNYWRNFIIRRVLRIFPLYYFALGLFILISETFPEFSSNHVVNYSYFKENQIWYWLYLSNIKMFIVGEWLPTLIFNPFWSLSIEEQFYIFWPLLVYRLKGKNLMGVITTLVIGSILLRFALIALNYSDLSIYVFTFSRLDAILLGSLIALMMRFEKWRSLLENYAFIVFIVVSILLFTIAVLYKSFNPYLEPLQLYGYTLIALLFCSLLLMVISKSEKLSFLKSVFQNDILVFLGKYSYSLYVFHWPFYLILNEPLKRILITHLHSPILTEIGTSLVALVLTIGASLLTWNLFEKRFIKLKSVLAPTHN